MPALPFKLNQDRRHHIPRQQHKVTNWPAYEAWQKASGYNKRAKVEASIGRWKQVIGDGLRSRIDERRMTEVNVAVDMLELGRPNYVRIV
jgi:hypothetical protein